MADNTLIIGRVPQIRGDYSDLEFYYRDNIVLFQNTARQCKVDGPIKGIPPTNEAYWALFSGTPVVQELGESESEVMSQKGVAQSSMEYNVSLVNEGQSFTLEEAIARVPSFLRRLGQKVSFTSSITGLAETWMYIGTSSNSWGTSNFVACDSGFNGQIFDLQDHPYNVDSLKTTGIYVKKNGTPYILIVKKETNVVYQVRFYIPDLTNICVISKRTYSIANSTWSAWDTQEVTTKDYLENNIFPFDGFVDTDNAQANNYLDKVVQTGMYKRARNGSPILYFVKTIGSEICQTQLYFNDSKVLVFRERFKPAGGSWTEWSTKRISFDISSFSFSNVDNIRSYGTYISSETYNNGVLYVMRSELYGYDLKQIIHINDTNSGMLKVGVRHHESGGNWMGWGWSNFEDTTIKSQLAESSINVELSDYPQYNGYISQRDLSVNANANYRVISIPLADLPKGQKFITIPCQGGAILLVGYWKGNYTNSSNYLGRDSITAFSNAGSTMYRDVPLSNLIPEGATHMTICWNVVGAPELKVFNPSSYNSSEAVDLRVLPSLYMGRRETEFEGMGNALVYKRGALKNLVGEHNDLIIIGGQSNADGRAERSEAPQWLRDLNYKINDYMVWNPLSNTFQSWELGSHTGNEVDNSDCFGFDIYFAKKYLESHPGKKLYAIKQSVGGTPISPLRYEGETRRYCWTPTPELITDGGLSMCEILLDKIDKAFKYASRNGIRIALKAVLWHQGEADMDNPRASHFEESLKGLISWMRGIWAAPALPIINGQISSMYDTTWQPSYSANITFTKLNAEDPYFKTVDMQGQAIHSDNVHFAAGGYEHLGYEMWEFYKIFNPLYC